MDYEINVSRFNLIFTWLCSRCSWCFKKKKLYDNLECNELDEIIIVYFFIIFNWIQEHTLVFPQKKNRWNYWKAWGLLLLFNDFIFGRAYGKVNSILFFAMICLFVRLVSFEMLSTAYLIKKNRIKKISLQWKISLWNDSTFYLLLFIRAVK